MASANKISKTLPRGADLDMISNVPDNVIDQILSYLPIAEAGRTSVLSTKWRNRWATVPSLVFDDNSFPLRLNSPGDVMVKKLVVGIDRILLLHSGAIKTFKLSYNHNIPSADINRWILYLSRRSIKELSCVFFSRRPYYQMPAYLFSCQNLTHLKLKWCALRPPPSSFTGFKQLKSLDLHDVTLSQDVLDKLISSSPLLEWLNLHGVFGTLDIDAPNLVYFNLSGDFAGVSFKNTTRLVEFLMDRSTSSEIGNARENGGGIKLLGSMPRVDTLSITSNSLEYLACGFIPQELSVPSDYLENLVIQVDFTSSKEVATFQCLLRSAPNLQQLDIVSCSSRNETCNWDADKWIRPFARLRNVKILINGDTGEMHFIKFLLLTSPALLLMTVTLNKDIFSEDHESLKFEVLKELTYFNRASSQAKIVFLES